MNCCCRCSSTIPTEIKFFRVTTRCGSMISTPFIFVHLNSVRTFVKLSWNRDYNLLYETTNNVMQPIHHRNGFHSKIIILIISVLITLTIIVSQHRLGFHPL